MKKITEMTAVEVTKIINSPESTSRVLESITTSNELNILGQAWINGSKDRTTK